MWKVYDINSGKLIKAGFNNEEQASDWLEQKSQDNTINEYDVEEMTDEEIELFENEELNEEDALLITVSIPEPLYDSYENDEEVPEDPHDGLSEIEGEE